MERQEWKVIEGYEGLYEVSYDGEVYSHHTGKDLKPGRASSGYMTVSLNKNGKPKSHTVHRLVAKAFIPNPENKTDVDHINRNRTDNRVENLIWASRSDNNVNTCIRKDNKTGYKNICKTKWGYEVQINRNKLRYRKHCKTLDEAIAQKSLMLSMWI